MEFKVNIKNKCNTTEYWEANDFVPLAGELVYYSDVDKFKIGTYNGTDETTKVALSKLPFIKSVDDIKLVDQQHSHEYKYVSNALFTGDAANYTTYTSEISNHKLVLNKTVTTTITPSGEISLNVQSKSTSIEGSNVSLEENK